METRGGGPPLVALPGWAMPMAVMWPWLDTLSARWRVTGVDLPGQGDSPDFAYDLSTLAESVAEAVPDGSVGVGWSLGGQIILAAALAGAPFRGLLLVGATPRFVSEAHWPWARDAGEVTHMRRQLTADPAATVRGFVSLLAAGSADRRTAARLARRAGGAALGLESGLRCLAETDLRPSLPALGTRSVWLTGAADGLAPPEAARAAAAMMPDARARVVADAGHLPFITHPDAVGDALGSLRTE